MATKKTAVAKTAKKAGKAVPVRKAPAKKTAPAKRAVKAASAKAAPKKPAASKAVAKKVTAKTATKKMVRPAAKPARPAQSKTAAKKTVQAAKPKSAAVRKAAAAPARPAKPAVPRARPTAVKAAKPKAAKAAALQPNKTAKPKAAPVKASKRAVAQAAPARTGRRMEERRALPHKEPPKPVFTLNDYFDMNASPYPTVPPSRREVLPVAVEWKERMRPGELYQAFKRFFEANEIGNRLTGSLREQSAAILEFEGDPQIYKIVKIRGRTAFEPGRPASAEIYLKFSRHAVETLLAPNATKPAEYVDRFCTLLADTDPQKRVEFKLLCTQGEAIRKGYLGVVAAGGKRLAEALVPMGYGMPQDFIRQLK